MNSIYSRTTKYDEVKNIHVLYVASISDLNKYLYLFKKINYSSDNFTII